MHVTIMCQRLEACRASDIDEAILITPEALLLSSLLQRSRVAMGALASNRRSRNNKLDPQIIFKVTMRPSSLPVGAATYPTHKREGRAGAAQARRHRLLKGCWQPIVGCLGLAGWTSQSFESMVKTKATQ